MLPSAPHAQLPRQRRAAPSQRQQQRQQPQRRQQQVQRQHHHQHHQQHHHQRQQQAAAGACRRRVLLLSAAAAAWHGAAGRARAGQQQQQPPEPPVCASCLGSADGTLGTCDGFEALPCASSFDDRPAFFAVPWSFDGPPAAAQRALVQALAAIGAAVQQERKDYVLAALELPALGPLPPLLLDLEFALPPADNTVSVRCAQHVERAGPQQQQPGGGGGWAAQLLAGQRRGEAARVLEELRLRLGWEQVPVLRARTRVLLFGESPWDTFGPEGPPNPDDVLRELLRP